MAGPENVYSAEEIPYYGVRWCSLDGVVLMV